MFQVGTAHPDKGKFVRVRAQQQGHHSHTTWFRVGGKQPKSDVIPLSDKPGLAVHRMGWGGNFEYRVIYFPPEQFFCDSLGWTQSLSELRNFLMGHFGVVYELPKPKPKPRWAW